MGGRGSSCLLWEHGADQLLIVGTLGHVQGVQLLSEYIGAESTVSTQGQGSSCLLWVHGGQGVQLLTVGTWGRPAAYSRYFGACAGGPAT